MANEPKELAQAWAKALYGVLQAERGTQGASDLSKELSSLVDLSRGDGGAFFQNPQFSKKEKEKFLQDLCKKHRVDKLLFRFLSVLVAQGAVALLPQIAQFFLKEDRQQRGELVADVETAFPLSDSEEKHLRQSLEGMTGKKVLLEITQNKDLIGGLTVRVESSVLDASIRGYVDRLEKEF